MSGPHGVRRSESCDLDVTVVDGDPRRYTHVVLSIPREVVKSHISSLTLLLSQLTDAARAEDRGLLLTIQYVGGEIPIKGMLVTDKETDDIMAALVDGYIKAEKEEKKPPDDAAEFSWKGLDDVFKNEQQTITHRFVVLFAKDGTAAPRDDERADLLIAGYSPEREAYPFNITPVKASAETDILTRHFSAPSPCDAHARLAQMFGKYKDVYGLRPIKELFRSSDIARNFLLKNSLRAVIERKNGDTITCSAGFAHETSSRHYFSHTEKIIAEFLRYIAPLVKKDDPKDKELIDEIKRFAYRQSENDWPDWPLIASSLFLFADGKNALPLASELVGVPSAYYELLRERAVAGDKDAASLFLNHAMQLYFYIAVNWEDRPGYNGPILKETISRYLTEMNATPLDMFRGVFEYERVYTVFKQDELDHVRGGFAALAENFHKLPRERRIKEVDAIVAMVYKNIEQLVPIHSYNARKNSFDLALGATVAALSGDEELTRRFANGLVGALTSIDPERLEKPVNIHEFVGRLQSKGILNGEDAERIIRWSAKINGLERDDWLEGGNDEIVPLVWGDLWPLLSPRQKEGLQDVITDKAISTYLDRIRLEREGAGKTKRRPTYFFIYKTIFSRTISSILDAPHLGKITAALMENDPDFLDREWDYSSPLIGIFHSELTFADWKGFLRYLMSNSRDWWRLIPSVLIISEKDTARGDLINMFYDGIKGIDDFRKVFSDERYYIIEMIKAIHGNDVAKMSALIRSYPSILTSEKEDGMHYNTSIGGVAEALFESYLTDEARRALVTYLLKGAVKFTEPLDIDDFNALLNGISRFSEAVLTESYDDNIHGDIWQEAFEKYYDEYIERGWRSINMQNLLGEFYVRLPPQRKAAVIEKFMGTLPTATDYWYRDNFLGNFIEFLKKADNPDLVMMTRPVFPYILKMVAQDGIEDIFESSSGTFVIVFYRKWLEYLADLPFEVQCEAFTYFAGPLAPVTRQVENSSDLRKFLNQAVGKIIGTKDGGQDRAKAYRLGRYIAASPYVMFLAGIFSKDYLKPEGVEGIIEGFIDAAAEGGKMKEADISRFVEAAFFAYFARDRKAFYAYLPDFISRHNTLEMARTALSPVRDAYLLQPLDPAKGLDFSSSEVELFKGIILNKGIAPQIRRYVFNILKGIYTNLSELPQPPISCDMASFSKILSECSSHF